MMSDFIETPIKGDKKTKKSHKASNFKDDTPNINELCNDLRGLPERDYRRLKRLAKQQRKLDKLYARITDEQECLTRLQLLDKSEFKQALRYGDTLRQADIERCKAELIQKRASKNREKAQQEA